MENNNINNNINKNSDQYRVALKFVNKILVNLEKEEIDDFTKFINIDREDIIKDCNKQSLIDMEKELFPTFDKKASKYDRRDAKSFVLNVLRNFMKVIGHKMVYKRKEKCVVIENRTYKRSYYFYSIE